MFLSSYAPLWVVLAIQARDWRLSAGLTAVAFGSVLGLQQILQAARKTSPEVINLRRIEPRGGDVAAYLASYLIGFVTTGLTDWRDAAALLVFVLVLAIIYVRTGLIYINPVLALLGYRMVAAEAEISDDDAVSVIAITKSDSVRHRQVEASRLMNGVYLERS